MSKQVNIKKTVFNKQAFNDTVNTEFTQLVVTPDPSFFDINLATQNDFWVLYEKFFYEIPKDGEINSHQYLAKTSGEYADFQPQADEIQALLEEIAELRQENLEVRQEVAQIVQEFQQQETAAAEAAQAAASG
jgi:hypothetical protein|tara:strand:+ start:103 stop:501 length:399 start_codon:yes stop_codon:yes gene_type:complete